MKDSAKTIGIIIVVIAVVFAAIYCACNGVWIKDGYEGIVYSMKGGVKDETLGSGFHMTKFTEKVKKFTISNEQLILTKDSRDGSEEDESFKVATADDASIAISFQMTYKYVPDTLVETYKKFRGMNGEEIVDKRVRTVLKSKISEITTDYTLMDIYSGNRSEINNKITKYLADEFIDSYGIEVIEATIIDVHPDDQLMEAINNRVTALQQKQQAEAEQEKIRVESETAIIKAEADAKVKVTQAEAEAKANAIVAASITDELIRMKEAEARLQHGWVTTKGADAIVKEGE